MSPSRKLWILLSLPLVITAVAILILLNWHIPAHIRVILKTNRVAFTVAGSEKSKIIDSLGLKSVVIEHFANVSLRPQSVSPTPAARQSKNFGKAGTSAGIKSTVPMVILPVRES